MTWLCRLLGHVWRYRWHGDLHGMLFCWQCHRCGEIRVTYEDVKPSPKEFT